MLKGAVPVDTVLMICWLKELLPVKVLLPASRTFPAATVAVNGPEEVTPVPETVCL